MAITSLRTQIADKLVTIFSAINTTVMLPDGITPKYHTDVLYVQRALKFIDEIMDTDGFPSIYLTAASESRLYTPSHQAQKQILFIVRGYIQDEVDSEGALNNLMQDVEVALNESFFLDQLGDLVNDIRIAEITSDEGLLHPEAVFEMIIEATVVETI